MSLSEREYTQLQREAFARGDNGALRQIALHSIRGELPSKLPLLPPDAIEDRLRDLQELIGNPRTSQPQQRHAKNLLRQLRGLSRKDGDRHQAQLAVIATQALDLWNEVRFAELQTHNRGRRESPSRGAALPTIERQGILEPIKPASKEPGQSAD